MKTIDLEFTKLMLFDDYVISEPKYGVDITVKMYGDVFCMLNDYFNHPYGYISNRTNDFSFNPIAHLVQTTKFEQIVSYSVVTKLNRCEKTVKIEQPFFQEIKPYAVFSDLQTAIEWTQRIVIDRSSNIIMLGKIST